MLRTDAQEIAEPANVREREMELLHQAKHSMEYFRSAEQAAEGEGDVCVAGVAGVGWELR